MLMRLSELRFITKLVVCDYKVVRKHFNLTYLLCFTRLSYNM